MARPSNRAKVLEAAVRLAQREGVTAVTLDSVAAEAALTKGGLMYHFPSREALLAGVEEYLAASWNEMLTAAAGKPAAEVGPRERMAAYAAVATQSASSAELAFIIEFSKHGGTGSPWARVAAEWTPSVQDAMDDPELMDLFLARLAADGLWVLESLACTPMGDDVRRILAERIVTRIVGAGDAGAPA